MSSRTGPVPLVPQTLDELLEANEGYLNWLDSIGAEEAKNEFILGLEKAVAPSAGAYYYVPQSGAYHYIPPVASFPSPLVRVADISLSPYTHKSKNTASAADPLNLIFTGKGEVNRVAEILAHELFPPWLSTEIREAPPWPTVIRNCSEIHYVYVDVGGQPNWKPMNHTLAVGGCALHRCHIRLFDGGYSEQLGQFTLAGVHYEQSHLPKLHVVQDWDKSQDFACQLFESKPFCKKIREIRLQAQGEELQRVTHDGLASIIELQ